MSGATNALAPWEEAGFASEAAQSRYNEAIAEQEARPWASFPKASPVVEDLGGWMQTRSGRAYHFANPQQSEIVLGDIAHALSNACRFGGHPARFYSVAEHSVLVSLVVEKTHPEHAFAALMHDATEAYVCDIPRPLKHLLGVVYGNLEAKAWNAICLKFGICPTLAPCVKEADNTVLLAERDALLEPPPIPWAWAAGLKPAEVTINCWTPRIARNVFIDRFRELRERS